MKMLKSIFDFLFLLTPWASTRLFGILLFIASIFATFTAHRDEDLTIPVFFLLTSSVLFFMQSFKIEELFKQYNDFGAEKRHGKNFSWLVIFTGLFFVGVYWVLMSFFTGFFVDTTIGLLCLAVLFVMLAAWITLGAVSDLLKTLRNEGVNGITESTYRKYSIGGLEFCAAFVIAFVVSIPVFLYFNLSHMINFSMDFTQTPLYSAPLNVALQADAETRVGYDNWFSHNAISYVIALVDESLWNK